MTTQNDKRYQIMNFQHQPVKVCETLDDAQRYIRSLQETYNDEGFYLVELNVVFSIGTIL